MRRRDEWMRVKSRCREDWTGLDRTGLPLQELYSQDNFLSLVSTGWWVRWVDDMSRA